MRTIAFLIPFLAVAAWSCNDTDAHEPVFGGELPALNFVVDPHKDTLLKTPGGALINIPAGTLDPGNLATVTLEVREALSSSDMNRGGLTRGGDQPQGSNGMIYINAAGGQSVNIHKPLGISLPAKQFGDMVVYKGEAAGEANLRWTDPRPLFSSPTQRPSGAGKTLFETRCASCHHGKEETTAPPLAWITRRRDPQWLYAFTRNNATLLWRGDGYSCYLFNRYKTPMPLFKDLSDADLAALYRYIDNASNSIDSNAVADHKRGFDSCVANDPNCGAVAQRTKAAPDQQATAPDATTTELTAQSPAVTTTAPSPGADYYTFNIDKHGWYNVALKPGSTASVTADAFPESTGADSVQPAPPLLEACPCWCNEAAYRRADSLSRPEGRRPHRVKMRP